MQRNPVNELKRLDTRDMSIQEVQTWKGERSSANGVSAGGSSPNSRNQNSRTRNSRGANSRMASGARSKRRMALGIALSVGGVLLWMVARAGFGLFFNGTVSLPMGIYQLRDTPLEVGDVVVSCLGEEASALALARSYLGDGDCPHGTAPVGKVLAAVAGDTVSVARSGVRVRGRLLPNSAPLRRDSHGFTLPDARGTYILKAGEAWLYSGYDGRSFDSRYFGPVEVSKIRGEASPLWIWQSPYDPRADLGLTDPGLTGRAEPTASTTTASTAAGERGR